jgi:L-arabinose transport system ATP-binding protein
MSEAALAVENVSKSFGIVPALSSVSLEFRAGEVTALVGENGAGKSTLLRIIEGVVSPDAGTIRLAGRLVSFSTPREAHTHGIRVIHQEPEIVPQMTVAENIYLGVLPPRFGLFLNRSRLIRNAGRLLADFGMNPELDPKATCEGLGPAQRQMIEIMRAVHIGSKVVAFDEPTSSLTDEEARQLFKIISRLRAEGVAIIYISHRLPEVMALADRVAVLRDGRMVQVLDAAEATSEIITRLMVGRDLSEMFPPREHELGPVLLKVERLTTDHVREVSFELKAGEVLGIGGLMGAGRSELAKGVFGYHPRKAGRVTLDGLELPSADIGAAIMAGMGFAPEDRKEEALLLIQSILDNAVLCVPDLVSRRGLFSRRRAGPIVKDVVQRLAVKAPSLDTPVGRLSEATSRRSSLPDGWRDGRRC